MSLVGTARRSSRGLCSDRDARVSVITYVTSRTRRFRHPYATANADRGENHDPTRTSYSASAIKGLHSNPAIREQCPRTCSIAGQRRAIEDALLRSLNCRAQSVLAAEQTIPPRCQVWPLGHCRRATGYAIHRSLRPFSGNRGGYRRQGLRHFCRC